jgi:hypothetical protein
MLMVEASQVVIPGARKARLSPGENRVYSCATRQQTRGCLRGRRHGQAPCVNHGLTRGTSVTTGKCETREVGLKTSS